MNVNDDFVLICGDAGIVWDGGAFDRYIQGWYSNKPWTTLFCDGNHENHDLLSAYPVRKWNGGKVHVIAPNIIHLMRGQVFTICGKKFFVMGGAESHDKWCRKEGISWWANEMPSDAEYDEGFSNLKKVGNHVDYIISHCAPDSVQDCIAKLCLSDYKHDKLTNYLEVIKDSVEYEHWYCGHYHTDWPLFDEKHTAIYNDIIKIV